MDSRRKGVVRILLERNDVNPAIEDEYGRTSLLRAAQFGYEENVRILLERDDVDPKQLINKAEHLSGGLCGREMWKS